MDTLQSALQGVAQAVQSARQDREVAEQQAATHRGHVAELQSLYEKERLLREEAQAEVGRLRLRLSALEASSRPAAVPPPAPPGPDTVARSPRSAPGVRRHTAPLGGSASAWASFLAPTVQARLSSTTQELTRLRDALWAAQQVGGARDDGSLKLLGANNGESNRKNGEPSKALLMHVIPPTQPAPPSPHAPPTPLSPTASGGLRPRPRPRQPSEAALEKRGSVLSLSELSHMLRRALELQADAVEACSESLAGIEGGAAPGEEGEGELSPADQAQTSRRARHSFVPGGSLERRIVVQNAGHTPPKSPAPGSSPSPSSPPSSPSSSAHSSEADAEISLADDGSAGVGATAAAAMSVALAQAWAGAGARGAGPTSARRRREDEGVEDGEASQAGQANAQCDVHGAPAATESSSHLQAHSSEDSVCRNPPPSASALARASSSRQGLAFAGAKAKFRLVAAVPRGSDRRARGSSPEGARWPARQLPHGSRPTPASSSAALQGLEGEAVPPLGEAELRWREGASQLKLQWLSEPRTALLVAKPVPQAQAHAAQAALCLARRGIVAVVEPGAHGPLLQRVFALAGDEDEGGRRGERGFLTSPSAPALLGVGEEEGGATKQGTTGAILNSAFQQAVRAASPPLTRERLARLIVSWAPAPDLPDEADAVGELLPQPIPPDVAHRIDVVYTLGGDGTLLWTCALFGRRAVPPVVPFALGSLGFLTPFPPASLEGVLRHTLSTSQAFPLMLRHRLHCRVLRREGGGKARRAEGDGLATRSGEGLGARPKEEARSGAPPSGARSSQGALHSGVSASSTEAGATHAGDKPQHAPSSPGGSEPPVRECRNAYEDDGECCGVVLNELVIDRGQATSLTCLEVYADRHFVTVIAGDGLIVATPTGSTAYNLAAGGSMIHPGVPAMLFTPICPHTLASRPLVFPDNVTLSIRVSLDSRAGAYCGFDGKNRMHLRPGDGLVIKLSQWPVPTVCNLDASHDWFLAARDGLNWNVRHAQDPLHSPPRLER